MPVQTHRTQRPSRPAGARECGICQSGIAPAEETQTCPACGLTFHSECWQENWGCAAYGCKQVNALKPANAVDAPSAAVKQEMAEELGIENTFPWDYAILGYSAIAMVFSALTFGVPSMLALLAIITRFNFRDRIKAEIRVWLLGASAAGSVVGIIAGWKISSFWWLGS